jgi:hypothetical protein
MARRGSSRGRRDLRDTLREQHETPCHDFESLGVCPMGARCQKMHMYSERSTKDIVTMLDFLIGQVAGISAEVVELKEQVRTISTQFKVDQTQAIDRGRTQFRRNKFRAKSQMAQ